MIDLAIKVSNVSKVFQIYDSPSARLKETFSPSRKKYHTTFSALSDITFEVKKGEFWGIVGKNGAGKSTLLKILSGELSSTSGSITIYGKLALLQLGMGFNPELSGVENARFASKLLGYNDEQIKEMLQGIIEFADIGEFIHHPVKTYSSGMYSRLSFAVGVNINPDILIADEVLAVGDMRFAQKCLRKMRDFKENGKSVLLVTHDTSTVQSCCDKAMWLKDGRIFEIGNAREVSVDFYNYMLTDKLPNQYEGEKSDSLTASSVDEGINNNETVEWLDTSTYKYIGDGRAKITRSALVFKNNMQRVHTCMGNEHIILMMDVIIFEPMEKVHFGFLVRDSKGNVILHTNNEIFGYKLDMLQNNKRFVGKFSFKLPALANGNYSLTIGIQSPDSHAHLIDDICQFQVSRNDLNGLQCGCVIIEDGTFELN